MNPMRTMKLMVLELVVDGGRLWRSTGLAAVWATFGLGLAGGFPVAAQEPDGADTNEVMAAEVLARISELFQAANSAQAEQTTAPNGLAPTNGPAQGENRPEVVRRPDNANRFQNPGRSQNDGRRSRSGRSSRSRPDQGGGTSSANGYGRDGDRSQTNAAGGTNASLASLDYSAFRIIVDRNIFIPIALRAGRERAPLVPRPGPWIR